MMIWPIVSVYFGFCYFKKEIIFSCTCLVKSEADLPGWLRFLKASSVQLKESEGHLNTPKSLIVPSHLWKDKNHKSPFKKTNTLTKSMAAVIMWIPHLLCFLKMERYSFTSSGDPRTTGTRWWMEVGWTSRTFPEPVVAMPPACSMMKAMGLHSYSSLSWQGPSGSQIYCQPNHLFGRTSRGKLTLPLGLFTLAGYKKMPPYTKVRWTSATMEPTYRLPYGAEPSWKHRISVNIDSDLRDHWRPTFTIPYLGIFLLLHIFGHVRVEMLCVSFVQTVDFPLFLNLHVSIHQDELADGLENAKIRLKGCHQALTENWKQIPTGSSMKQLTPWPVERTNMVALPYRA